MSDLPILYGRDAKGKLRQWQVKTVGALVIMLYGTKGGKQQEEKYRAVAKNRGRANATTEDKQAELEAASLWQKKLDEGYDPDPGVALSKEVFLPMLAHRYDKYGKHMTFPCHMQRKYNGMRAMARIKDDGSVEMISRQGVQLTVPHVAADLALIGRKGDVFDGEMYCYGIPLQTIVSWVKDNRPESAQLRFYLYDMPKAQGDLSLPWNRRWHVLQDRMSDALREHPHQKPAQLPYGSCAAFGTLALSETRACDDMDAAAVFEKEAVGDGFEGIMLRDLGGEYRLNVRSKGLLKLKRFQDAEFEIVDVEGRELSASDKICSAYVLKNNMNDKTFKAVPVGSHAQKRKIWLERDEYIGQQATVRFLERSIDGIPIGNPVCTGLRDSADKSDDDPDDKMWSSAAE